MNHERYVGVWQTLWRAPHSPLGLTGFTYPPSEEDT